MSTYRVLRGGRLIRWESHPKLVSIVGIVLGMTVIATSSVAALLRPPAIGPRHAPAEGQTAIGYAGGPLCTYGPGRAVPIGSLAKVMTAYIILRHHPLRPGDDGPMLYVDEAAQRDYEDRRPSGQSLLRVEAGEQLTERQALQAILIPSANNIADLLAIWDAGSTAQFVAEMNRTAREFGMRNTHYVDPSGFEPGTISTAVEQGRLAEQAITLPELARIASLRTVELPVVGQVRNYNALLGVDGVIGLKTGTTDQAGGNLVFVARRGSRFIVGAVLGQKIGSSTPVSLSATFGVAAYLIESMRS